MKGKLKFFLFYFFFFFAFFQIARLAFLLYNFSETKALNFNTILFSFLYGMRMDIAVCSYIILPIFLFTIASIWIRVFREPVIYLIYSYVLLILLILLTLIDLQVYRSWGFRIDNTPLKYLESPREAWASVSNLPVFWIVTVFLLLCISACSVVRRLVRRKIYLLQDDRKPFAQLGVLLLLCGALIIPIRGGLQLSPMNQSTVYFSENNFANLSAINASWNFLYAIVQKAPNKNPYLYLDEKTGERIVDSLFSASGKTMNVLNTVRPNVILVVWESFTQKATETIIEGRELTPHFNKLRSEGIYFDHLYASGDRTDKGLAAVLAGYPALNKFSIIRYPSKSSKLKTLPQTFKSFGYQNRFYYGGETEFANIKSFLLQSGYDGIVDKNSFAKKDQNSKWGAHDGVVAIKILQDARNYQEPFFTTWLTLTSHEPFETPSPSIFSQTDDIHKFANSIHYSDESLFDFVEGCKKMPLWRNTLLIIIADHGHLLFEPSNNIDNFRIPMLWLGGALKQQGVVINRFGSQIDLAATLSAQLKQETKIFPFSKNLLDSATHQWAYYSFNNGFGFVQPSGQLVFDNVGKQIINERGSPRTVRDVEAGQAMQQRVFEDYLTK